MGKGGEGVSPPHPRHSDGHQGWIDGCDVQDVAVGDVGEGEEVGGVGEVQLEQLVLQVESEVQDCVAWGYV